MSRQLTALSNEQLQRIAPSIFAQQPWEKVSENYAFIPTSDVVNGLRSEGFVPVRASQSRTRIEGKGDFTKHMIRFRHQSLMTVDNVGEELPEIVLVNSHDRTSSYRLDAGIFRLACLNGMVVKSANFGSFSVQHSGNIVEKVINGSHEIIEQVPQIMDQVQRLKSINLNSHQQLAFAKSALALRWDVDLETGEINAPVRAEDLLRVKRYEDNKSDLWTTFNRVQENILRGGIRGVTTTGKRTTTRAVNSVTEDIRLNKSLWVLTEALAEAI